MRPVTSPRLVRIAGIAIALALLPALAACTGFAPVYGPQSIETQGVAIAYAAPTNRLEQIVYEDLALRLGRATPAAPLLTVSIGSRQRSLTYRTIVTANYQKQATVTARIKLVAPDGRVLFSGTRSETADYTNDPQLLANQQAADDAAARAAHLLADNIRLTVLGALAQ